jgi:hypothetical protein
MATTIRLNRWWRCNRWLSIISTVLIVKLDDNNPRIIHLSPQDVEDACRIAKHLKMEVKEKDGEIHLKEAADWRREYNFKIWLEEDLHKILKAIGLEDLKAWKKKYNIITYNKHLKLEMLLTINNIAIIEIHKNIRSWKSEPQTPKEVDEIIERIINGRIRTAQVIFFFKICDST